MRGEITPKEGGYKPYSRDYILEKKINFKGGAEGENTP